VRRTSRTVGLLVVVALVASACTNNSEELDAEPAAEAVDPSPPEEDGPPPDALADDVVPLGVGDVDGQAPILEADEGQLRFVEDPGLEVGQVVVSGVVEGVLPDGFVGRVTSVTAGADGSVTVATEPVGLTDVFETLTVSATFEIPADDVDAAVVEPVVGNPLGDGVAVAVRVSGDGSTVVPAVDAGPSLGVSTTLSDLELGAGFSGGARWDMSMMLDVEIVIRDRRVEVFRFVVSSTLEGSMELTVAANTGRTAEKEWALRRLPNLTIPTATGIPIVINPTLGAQVTANAAVDGEVGLTSGIALSARAGAVYQNGRWQPVGEANATPRLSFVLTSLSGRVSLTVGPYISTRLWVVVPGPKVSLAGGPSATINGCEGLAMTFVTTSEISLLDTDAMKERGIPGVSLTVLDRSWPVPKAQATCSGPPAVDLNTLDPVVFKTAGTDCLSGLTPNNYQRHSGRSTPNLGAWKTGGALIEVVASGDLTGDGRDELIVEASCAVGGETSTQEVLVFTSEAQPKPLGTLFSGLASFFFYDQLMHPTRRFGAPVEIVDRQVRGSRMEWVGTDEATAAQWVRTQLRWVWNPASKKFERTVVSGPTREPIPDRT
jgi:hypothetical protein